MITLPNYTSHLATPGRTHSIVTAPTCPATVSPNVVHTTLVNSATSLGCSIRLHRVPLHPLGNAAGSRDAP